MFDEKSDLYRAEWLDLVFAGRNKEYGAYQLRLHNGQTTLRALLLASVLVTGLIMTPYIYGRYFKEDIVVEPVTNDDVFHITDVKLPAKQEQPKEAAPQKQQEPKKVRTERFVKPVVVPVQQVVEDPPSTTDLQNAQVGVTDVIGEDAGDRPNMIEDRIGQGGNGVAEEPVTGNEIFVGVEEQPSFPGGLAEFGKYLSKNINYPDMARANEISGKVIVSFVVEKNGDLSNIKVLRGIGGGCDEEAVRVLKKAPAWKAGKQNGQPVRVAYTVPIMFNLER